MVWDNHIRGKGDSDFDLDSSEWVAPRMACIIFQCRHEPTRSDMPPVTERVARTTMFSLSSYAIFKSSILLMMGLLEVKLVQADFHAESLWRTTPVVVLG